MPLSTSDIFLQNLLWILLLFGLAACSSNNSKPELPSASAQANQQPTQSTTWRCDGTRQGGWRCIDQDSQQVRISPIEAPVVVETPAPATSIASTSPDIPQQEIDLEGTTAESESTNTEAADSEELSISEYLNINEYPDHFYTVQLLAAKHEETVRIFLQQHPDLAPLKVTINNNGMTHQLLLLGVYETFSEAQHAVNSLDTSLREKPWIRPLAPLKKLLIENTE